MRQDIVNFEAILANPHVDRTLRERTAKHMSLLATNGDAEAAQLIAKHQAIVDDLLSTANLQPPNTSGPTVSL